MTKIQSLNKVLRFGMLGAFGCLIGWGIGEVFLRIATPLANAGNGLETPSILTPPEPPKLELKLKAGISEQLTAPVPDPPPALEPFLAVKPPEPTPLSAEIAERLAREGAHQGDVEIALIWWNTSDLDLHVIDPAGEEIWFSHKKAQSGGELDVDMNVSNLTNKPVEHVYFPKGGAPEGQYKVSVECYSDRSQEPIPYKIEVLASGERRVYEGAITNRGKTGKSRDQVCEFSVKIPPPQIRLSVPESVSILPGSSNVFRVLITRANFDTPVSIRLDSSSEFTIDEAQITAGESTGTVTLRAGASVSPGPTKLRVTASAETSRGHVEESVEMRVSVVEPPKPKPVIQLSSPQTMQVLQGNTNRFKARVGRYYFPHPPSVAIILASDDPDLVSKKTNIAAASDEAVIEVKAARNARPGIHNLQVIASTSSPAIETTGTIAVEVIALPVPRFSWTTVGIVGAWTAFLGIGLSFLLKIGQNQYLRRSLMSFREAGVLLIGGLAAGGVSGGGGQMLHSWLGRLQAQGVAAIPPEAGQVAGWCILGLLLGYGVAFYIPNLSKRRAAIAGGLGGLLGVAGFLCFTLLVGEISGRVVGAATLGFAIGCMVALIEAVSREAWLEIQYSPKEIRSVSLGLEPISIGSDQNECTIFANSAPPIAYRYWLKDNAISCQDVASNRTTQVSPGDRKQVGKVVVTVRTPGIETAKKVKPAASQGNHGYTLRLTGNKIIALGDGLKLMAKDLPGLEPEVSGGAVAQVNCHPKDPSVFGLRNLSSQTWTAKVKGNDQLQIKPGQNIKLASGTKIDFGTIQGEIEA